MKAKYYLWTIGCQMNEADSRRLADELQDIGWQSTTELRETDLVVLNTCVVRQQAEDKAYGRLGLLRKLKSRKPGLIIALMGCLVGREDHSTLKAKFPHVDVFLRPSEFEPLLEFLTSSANNIRDNNQTTDVTETKKINNSITALVPVVLGCSHACAFCVIPSRRGPERSRPLGDIVDEISRLTTEDGVREVLLLGQIIDRYGRDITGGPDLADLLCAVAANESLYRVRFLTSHPNWINDRLINVMLGHEKICPCLEIAVQSGNDTVLERMHRGHKIQVFYDLVAHVRKVMPDVAINTDIIVGFPGETDEQFQDTCRLLSNIEFDVVRLAKYSERPGTYAARHYRDDIPEEAKEERRLEIEALQKEIQARKAGELLGKTVSVLVDGRLKDRWQGRTPQNKLVFFADEADCHGRLIDVTIDWAGPFSLVGKRAPNRG